MIQRKAKYTHCHNPKCRGKLESDNVHHQTSATCQEQCYQEAKIAYSDVKHKDVLVAPTSSTEEEMLELAQTVLNSVKDEDEHYVEEI